MRPPATEPAMEVSSFWPKLMIKGNKAEQPRPERANAARPGMAADLGRQAQIMKAAQTTSGRTRKTTGSGNHPSITANKMRPAVTAAQNTASAAEARNALALREWSIKSDAQFPLMVSQTPYSNANAAKSQKRVGNFAPPDCFVVFC